MRKNIDVMYVRANGIYSDSRATKEIFSLLKMGYKIILVGWDRDGKSEEMCRNIFEEYSDQITYHMYKSRVGGNVGFKNIVKLYRWLRYVRKVYSEYKTKIQVIHACNLDSIIFCYKKCKVYNTKIVYDIFDYYVDNHVSIPKCLVGLIESIEVDIINNADVCIICTEERREQIKKAKPRKVIVIHNTPDVELLDSPIEFDYFYCGILFNRRLIEEILNAYGDNEDIRVGIAGFGPYKEKVLDADQKYKNLTYHGQITYKDCLELESKAVCLSAIYEPTIRNHKLCAPNKFYEALALGKPIIVCEGTGIDKIVDEYKIGIVINYSASEFFDAVRYLKENSLICKEMGKRARKLYEEKYNWKLMEEILLSAYDEICL